MLDKFNAALEAISYPSQPQGLYEPISYTLSMGGKRLRPCLLLLAYSLNREDEEKALLPQWASRPITTIRCFTMT